MMYGYDLAGLGGWWMLAGMIVLGLVVLGSVWLIVRRPTSEMSADAAATRILRERYARGELSGEEFEEAQRRLG